MRGLLLLFVLGGCRQILGIEDGRLADPAARTDDIDAIDAAPTDAFDARCFGSGAFAFCLAAVPGGTLALTSVDTSTCTGGVIMPVAGQSACVIAAGTIDIATTVVTKGSRPLVLAATGSINLTGELDASSLPNNPGPAANASGCTTALDGAGSINSGGGGAGGTFGTSGGNGGSGAGGNTSGGAAAPAPSNASNKLRGSCRGGAGGQGSGAGGVGGDGGGALYLAPHGTLTLGSNALLHANGARGAGGSSSSGGGGGGGSGGMIVIHAATLSVANSAKVTANGGGGGGGAGQLDAGEDGNNPNPTNPSSTANGGNATTNGRSRGGNGAAGLTSATAGETGTNGGGGGGGGHGQTCVLRPNGALYPAGSISPAPST